MAESVDCVVIGAGVIGLAIAREMAAAGLETVVLEKENRIGTSTSSRNSEVIHAGIYYQAGSLKAGTCVAGKAMLYDYCRAREVPHENTSSYGIVAADTSEHGLKMTEIVEKPDPADAPSNLAVVGRYLLAPEIWDKLENTGRGAGGEIQLTDAIADLLEDKPVYAHSFSGTRYDCGSKLGYLQATVAFGLEHESVRDEFRAFLKALAG